MTTARQKSIGIALAVALIVTGLIVAGHFLPLGEWLRLFDRWASNRGTIGVFVFSGIYILAVLLLLPSSVFTMSAGVTYGLIGGTLLSVVSATVAAGLAFAISRHCAHASVQRWITQHRKVKALDHALLEHEWKLIFLLRLAPIVPFGPVNYSLGLSNVHFWTYISATAAGILPGTFLYVYAGYAGYAFFGEPETQSNLHSILIAGGLLLVIVLALVLGYIAKKALDDIDQRTT